MTQKIDLKPRRELIDSKFEGYKLSLDALPQYRTNVVDGLDTVRLSDDQYSYQHIRTLGIHNHLVSDPWCPRAVYYISSQWTVVKSVAQEVAVDRGEEVFSISDAASRRSMPGRYSVSLQFITADRVVLSDGTGQLYLLDTGARQTRAEPWKVIFVKEVFDDNTPFLLLDCTMKEVNAHPLLDCALVHIEETEVHYSGKIMAPYTSILEWITFSSGQNNSWTIGRRRTLISDRSPDYVALDRDDDAICVSSEKPFKMVHDSENPVDNDGDQGAEKPDEPLPPDYTWQQTTEDINVQFTVLASISKADIYINLAHNQINFGIKNGKELLKGDLQGTVDVEGSTWVIQGNRVELYLSKANGDMWQQIVVGDSRGEETQNDEQIQKIHEQLARLTTDSCSADSDDPEKAFNSQQLEACDAYPDDRAAFTRIDGNSHQVTHQGGKGVPVIIPSECQSVLAFLVDPRVRNEAGILEENKYVFAASRGLAVVRGYESLSHVCRRAGLTRPEKVTSVTLRKYMATVTQANLGSHQFLFNARVDANAAPVMCLRHDVDGLIWKLQTTSSEACPFQHEATFNAFGYVQASKQQKKFSTCCPNYSYAVICDCTRHVYVYRQPAAITSPLRNRKTGRQVNAVAKQQVISLDSVQDIMGVQATNNFLFLLTEKMLFAVSVNVEDVVIP